MEFAESHATERHVQRCRGVDDGHIYYGKLLGGCWNLYFLPGRIPSEFWPRLDPCCPSACPAHALHSCLDANIPVKWRMTKLGPLLFLDSFYQAANMHISLDQEHVPWLEINPALQVESFLPSLSSIYAGVSSFLPQCHRNAIAVSKHFACASKNTAWRPKGQMCRSMCWWKESSSWRGG